MDGRERRRMSNAWIGIQVSLVGWLRYRLPGVCQGSGKGKRRDSFFNSSKKEKSEADGQ